jgi:hypothetical protein
MRFVAYLLARFSEPSSYAGLGAVLALLGLHFSDSVTASSRNASPRFARLRRSC